MEPQPAAERRADLQVQGFIELGGRRLVNKVVDVFLSSDGTEGRFRNDHLGVVAARVGGVLLLGHQNPNHQERRSVKHDRFADCLLGAKEIVRQLVADKSDPPSLLNIEVIDKTAAGRGNHVSHGAVGRGHPGNRDRSLPVAITGDQAVGVLTRDAVDELDLRLQVLDVLLHHPHPASLAEALIDHRGPHRPCDDDAITETGDTLDHLPVETVAEGKQEAHRHRSPDDAEGGEKGAQLLAPQIAGQLPEE